MFKLVVLSALLAVAFAAPKPGYLHAAPLAVAHAPIAVSHAYPAAVSHQSRVDIHSKPLIATYAAAPLVHTAPLAYAHAAPLAYAAHGPSYSAYSTSVIGHPTLLASPHLGYASHGAYGVHPY